MNGYEFWDDPIAAPFSEPERDDTWQDFVEDWKDSQQARLARFAAETARTDVRALDVAERPA